MPEGHFPAPPGTYHPHVLIPLGSDVPLRRPTLITHVLIGLSIAAAVGGIALGAADPDLHERVMRSLAVVPGVTPWYTWVTYAFLHGGFLHLAGNCLFLFVFGPPVEDRLGRVWFAALYFAGAAFAVLAQWAIQGADPMIGASGAISCIAGAFLVLFPRSGVRIFLFFIMIGIITLPAWVFILMHVAWDILKLGSGSGGNVAVGAHLGGYALGAAVAAGCLGTGILKREGLDLFTLGKQAARRRAIKEASFRSTQLTRREPSRPPDPHAEALAQARARVLTLLSAGDHPGAVVAYHNLLKEFGHLPHGCTLPRERQYELANHLFQQGDHQTAAIAYARFLDSYAGDAETPVVKLMLGLLNARYLNDPIAAKRLIAEAQPDLHDEQHAALARSLIEDLG